jgi:hypothetical protein
MTAFPRACRYCKSPAWRNPCWWLLDRPEYARTGADLPCACDDWVREQEQRSRVWWRNSALVLLAIIGLCLLIAFSCSRAHAHWTGPTPAGAPDKAWWDQLASGKGLCCSFADGVSIKDVDWDTGTVADAEGQSHIVYRVHINGQWIDVPPEALVTVPNRFGPAVVWPYQDAEGKTQIRCFLPGAGT